MKNYFQKILSLFARHNYSEQTNQMFYRWLVNDEYEKEKDEALQEFYSEARKKGKIFDVEESLERCGKIGVCCHSGLAERNAEYHVNSIFYNG